MKRICIICICTIIILIPISVSAESFSAYSSVTENSSQISILLQYLFNQEDFDCFKDFVALRTGDYDYSLFYNIEGGNARRLRYYATSSGYNTIWHATISDVSNFSFNSGNYTVVGNVDNSLGSSLYQDYCNRYILKICIPFILVILIFFVWKIKHRNKELKI